MNPYDAYVNTATMTMSDREVEAAALTKAAALLKNCQANWNAPDRERSLAEALEFNQKLWCIFQASLAAPDHPLPAVLRQDVLRLGIFIDKRIFEVMAYPAPEKLKAIVEINLNLAAGPRAGGPGAENWKPAGIEGDVPREESVWA